MLQDLRLYQLISPSLPVGGFTYSQGLEWAVEAKWVTDKKSLEDWLSGMLFHSLATLELPVLLRLMQALASRDELTFIRWCNILLASRETAELRKEERQRGAALARLLPNLNIEIPSTLFTAVASTQLAGLALAARTWDIDATKTCGGYTWSWLENIVVTGVKLIPLGQTQGQQLLLTLAEKIPEAVTTALATDDTGVGAATPALAIASSLHENQYTRLFRS